MASFPSILAESAMASRFLTGLGSFLREAEEPACRTTMTDGLHRRAASLLSVVRQGIFAHDRSPYLALFRQAGLDVEGVSRLIRDHGVDGTLTRLHDAGVFVSLDEFKGRRPIRRGPLELPVSSTDFDNPRIRGHYQAQTSGSRGTPTRLVVDFAVLARERCYDREAVRMFDLGGRPRAVWRPVPPAGAGLKVILRHAYSGTEWDRWFSQTPVNRWTTDWRHTLFTHATTAASRLSGRPLPRPEHVPIHQGLTVAQWLADCVSRGTPGCLNAPVSSAVRACQAARDAGLDISGTFVQVGGEPLTPAKAAAIRRSGCEVRTQYALGEIGRLAMPCGDPVADDDLHVMEDAVALIERDVTTRRGETVSGLVLTALDGHAPKVMINVEVGDTAVVSRRPCRCRWHALGFDRHLQTIRSYDKLTSEGMHFLGVDLVTLVEETLPDTFGGNATDYQIVEEEDHGLTRVVLVVHPRVGPLSDAGIKETVWRGLAGAGRADRLMADLWRDAGTLVVRRRQPYLTASGKILTLHVRAAGDSAT